MAEQKTAEEEDAKAGDEKSGEIDQIVSLAFHIPAKDQEIADTLLESLASSVKPESPSNTTANRDKKANNLKSSRISLGL